MTGVKISGLSRLNVAALDEVFAPDVYTGELILTKSTANWPRITAEQAKAKVDEAIRVLPGRGHPKHSLHAVSRRLGRVEPTTEQYAVCEECGWAIGEHDMGCSHRVDPWARQEEIVASDGQVVYMEMPEPPSTGHPGVDKALAEIAKLDAIRPLVVAEYDEAWDEYAKNPDRPIDPEEELKLEKITSRVREIDRSIAAYKLLIHRLENPTPRDEAKTSRLENLKMAKKTVTDNSNVPAVYLSENGRFRPGADATYKSDLVHAALGEDKPNALHKFTVEDAINRLEQRSWTKYLDSARSSREAAAARKAARAEEAKARVTSKKSQPKQQPVAESGDEVTPDPKPERKPRGRGIRK